MRRVGLWVGLAWCACVLAGCQEDTEPPPTPFECVEPYWVWITDGCGTPPGAPDPHYDTYDFGCWRVCETDDDCAGTSRPVCGTFGLCDGGDFMCNRVLSVCVDPNYGNDPTGRTYVCM